MKIKTVKEFLNSKKAVLIGSYVLVAVVTASIIFTVPAIRYSPIVEPTVQDIDPTSFYEEYQKNPEQFIFLDVRSAEAYNKLHAVGSTLQPLHTLYTERHRLPRNDPNKTIILICSGGVASGVGFSYLQHYGFRNVKRIEGGIENWQTKLLPVEGKDVLK